MQLMSTLALALVKIFRIYGILQKKVYITESRVVASKSNKRMKGFLKGRKKAFLLFWIKENSINLETQTQFICLQPKGVDHIDLFCHYLHQYRYKNTNHFV
jgi:hypothetical protein